MRRNLGTTTNHVPKPEVTNPAVNARPGLALGVASNWVIALCCGFLVALLVDGRPRDCPCLGGRPQALSEASLLGRGPRAQPGRSSRAGGAEGPDLTEWGRRAGVAVPAPHARNATAMTCGLWGQLDGPAAPRWQEAICQARCQQTTTVVSPGPSDVRAPRPPRPSQGPSWAFRQTRGVARPAARQKG